MYYKERFDENFASQIALRIFTLTSQANIKLRVIWVPRSQVEKADFVSRIIDKDDWQIDAYWFKFICSRFGRPTIDRFADMFNTKLRRFNSRFYCHQSEGVDAFVSDRAGEFNLLVPPIHLIPRVMCCLWHVDYSVLVIVLFLAFSSSYY